MMEEHLYSHEKFEHEGTLWFVVGDGFDRDAIDPRLFCGAMAGGRNCLAVFSDEDLANQHAALFPGTASLGAPSTGTAIWILERLHPDFFQSVTIDAQGDQTWTNRTKTIPEFIAMLRRS